MFTRDQIEEIKKKLIMLGTKDTQFPDAHKLNGEEIVAIVQDGENKKIPLSSIINDDFINVSKDTTEILTLSTAVSKIDINNRKLGQVITFKDSANSWAIRQFTGSSLDNWNDISLWKSISGIDELKSQVESNAEDISVLSDEIERHDASILNLNTDVSKLKDKDTETSSSLSELTTRVDTLKSQADINTSNISSLNTEVSTLQSKVDEHTESINSKITTDRIEDGAVTSEKISPSAFDSTLSVSGKIAPADIVGEKITELEIGVDATKPLSEYQLHKGFLNVSSLVNLDGYYYVIIPISGETLTIRNQNKTYLYLTKSIPTYGSVIDWVDEYTQRISSETETITLTFHDAKYCILQVVTPNGNIAPYSMVLDKYELATGFRKKIAELYDSKQNTLQVGVNLDNAPIKDSLNPITSGAVSIIDKRVGDINEDVFKKKVVPTLTFEEGVSIIASGIKNTGWPNSVLSSPFSLKKGETLHITCTNAANRYCIAFPKDDGNTFNVLVDSLTDGTEHSYEYTADKDCQVVISYFNTKNYNYYISSAAPIEEKISELKQKDSLLDDSIKNVEDKIGNLDETKIVELEQKGFGDGRLKITNSQVVIDTTTLNGTWRHCYFDVTEGKSLHLKTRTAGGTNFWFIGTDENNNLIKKISSSQSGVTTYELDYVCESGITRIWMSCYTDGGDAQAKKSMSITIEKPVQISEMFKIVDAKIDSLMTWKDKTVLFYGDSVTYVAQSADAFAMKSGEAEYPYNIPIGSINWQKRVCEKLQIKKFYSRGIGGSKFEHEDWICYINNSTGAAVGNKETITDGTHSVTNHHAATAEAKELDFTWSHYATDPSIAPDVNGYTKIHTGMSDWDRIRAMIPESIANTIDAVFVMCHNSRVDNGVTPSYLNSGCPDVYWENESLNTLGGDFNTSDSANAILSIIHKLQVRCPNAVIIIGTPISGYQYGLKPANASTTSMSQAMADYTRAENIKKAAHLMASPVVDMFGTDGINPLNRNQYMADMIHPFTENGSKALARACSSGLLTILPKL